MSREHWHIVSQEFHVAEERRKKAKREKQRGWSVPKISQFETKTAAQLDQNDWFVMENVADNKNYRIRPGDLQSQTGTTTAFSTVAVMVASTDLTVGDVVYTQGYDSAGDGGAGVYRIVTAATGTADGGFYHDLTGISGQAALIYNGRVSIKQFGVTGDGATDDTAALNVPFSANAPDNLTIELVGDETYLQNGEIAIASTNPTIIGNGATIKRGATQQTTLSANAASGATTISVTSAAALNVVVGEKLLLVNTGATNGGQADGEQAGPYTIDSINSNDITFTAGIGLPSDGSLDGGGEWTSGLAVMKTYNQITQDEGSPFNVYNTVFDGNRDNNTVHNGWTVNLCVSRVSAGAIISGCTFHSMPNECMFLGYWATVTNNTAYDLNGSFTHTSSAVSSSADDHGCCLLVGNRVRDACESTPTINSHSEGVFNFSNESGKVVIADNVVDGCAQGFAGQLGNTGEVTVSGNAARNCKGVIGFRATNNRFGDITISGNTFNTCGALIVSNNSATIHSDAEGLECLTISGNTFVNCRVYLRYASNFSITGNTFTWEDTYTPGSTDFTLGDVSIDAAAYQLGISNCLRYSVSGNSLEDYNSAVNEIETAIFYDIPNTMPGVGIKTDASTTSSYYYYHRDSAISNNAIANYANGIGHESTRGHGDDGAVVGFQISSNSISCKDDSDSDWGIRGTPGALIQGNYIVCTSNTTDGIYLQGVEDASKSAINGEMVIGNTVLGAPTYSIRVGLGTGTQSNIDRSWNMTVINNVTDKAIEDNNPSQNVVSGNVQNKVTSTTIPIQATRANSGWN